MRLTEQEIEDLDKAKEVPVSGFAIALHCPNSNQFGVICAASDVACGADQPFAVAGKGAGWVYGAPAAVLNPWILEAAAAVGDPASALNVAAKRLAEPSKLQIAFVSTAPKGAGLSRKNLFEQAGHRQGDGFVIAGYGLHSLDCFEPTVDLLKQMATDNVQISEQLLAAAEFLGSQATTVAELKSTALLVIADRPFPLYDLRVDDAPGPLARLREIYDQYQIDDLDLDFCFPVAGDAAGRIPSPFNEAARWLKRMTRQALRRAPAAAR